MKKVVLLLSLVVFLVVSCANKEQEFGVANVNFTPCQQTKVKSAEFSGGVNVKFTDEGVKITQFDFEVTCDFTAVNVTHTFVNGVLRITQQSSPSQADCICYTDVSYTISGISQSEVNVIFINGEQVYCHNGENGGNIISLKVGEITEIKMGEIAINTQYGLSLRVENVNDSRCPTGAICVWQGVASVQLHLATNEDEHDFSLNKFGLEQGPSCEGVVVEGIKYYLVDVLPYPVEREEQPIKIVKILVTDLDLTGKEKCNSEVIISDTDYENAPNHPISIIDMKIEGNCLKIKFGASGCDIRNVKLIAGSLYRGGGNPYWTLRLSIDDPGVCARWITQKMSFNIEDLQIQGRNSVTLNISDNNILYGY